MRRSLPALAGVLPLLTGCALGSDVVAIRPAPVSAPVSAQAAALPASPFRATVSAAMAPGRDPLRVGPKRNGYGMATGSLFADRPVAAIVADALRAELARRGAIPAPGGAAVFVSVDRFDGDFFPGAFSSASDSVVVLSVAVVAADGRRAFFRTLSGHDHRTGLLLMTPGAARRGLDRALEDVLAALLADPRFGRALAAPPVAPG